jgi:23S rRNA pseudouridine1911/1915/1917 synthase
MARGRFDIIYEDDWLIVVDKPSGLLVIPTPKGERNTLTELLNRGLDSRRCLSPARAHPCHRLDRETSGLIIYAKGKKAQRLMMDEFRARAVKKAYKAIVQGIVRKDYGTIRLPVYNRNKNRNEPAITKYRVTERRNGFTVLETEPVTGRTNQIRIHLKSIGHPIVGESVYAFRKDFRLKFGRAALHAEKIEFTHPVTKKRLCFTAPIPDDMRNFLNKN